LLFLGIYNILRMWQHFGNKKAVSQKNAEK